jgi:hypothetical protein
MCLVCKPLNSELVGKTKAVWSQRWMRVYDKIQQVRDTFNNNRTDEDILFLDRQTNQKDCVRSLSSYFFRINIGIKTCYSSELNSLLKQYLMDLISTNVIIMSFVQQNY